MAVLDFSFGYVNTPPFFSGTSSTPLVPSVFPVAIDGRPYMIDQKSGRFTRGYEPRVRDSQDISTAPGEAAINPGGLWRRGQDSWHLGAGQKYADAAQSIDYRFYRSKGVNPWSKGQLSLLNDTKVSLVSTNTNLKVLEVGGYVYVADGQTLKFCPSSGTDNVFSSSPNWTSVTGSPSAAINDITTDGSRVYVAYAGVAIYATTVGGSSMSRHYALNSDHDFTTLGFAKGFVVAFHNSSSSNDSHVHVVPWVAANKAGTPTATIRDPNFICTGIAGGQNSIYIAGRGTDVGLVYRMGIKTDGTLDVAVVALELPVGEYPTSIYGYLGFVVVGTNKGVRVCSADQTGNLIAGSLIPTGSDVKGFTAEDRFVWFTWTNFDATSGLGRLDFSNFVAANTPAYATDLMLASSNASVLSVDTADSKRVFTISGVGVVVEDADSLVDVGYVESGVYRWGIPDRKFVAKVDTRAEPLQGSITSYLSLDESPYTTVGTWSTTQTTENTLDGSSQKAIQAGFKFELRPSDQHDSPVMTRWMTRAYAAPFRSQVFSVPILLHRKIRVFNKDYYYDTAEERGLFDNLIASPRVITMQLGELVYTVIVEDVEEIPVDSSGNVWDFEGTLVVTMRSVEN